MAVPGKTSAGLCGPDESQQGSIRRTRSTAGNPLQAALGYDLAQTLFVAPDNLLVEGSADLIYLQILSAACESGALLYCR